MLRRGDLRKHEKNKVTSNKHLFLVYLIFLCLSSFFSSRLAEAGNDRWKAIAGKNGEERILYDPDSIIPSGMRTFRVWIMGFDANGFSRKSQEEFDCSNKIVRDVEVILERPGKPMTRANAPSEWRGVVRETPRWELFQTLCR
jgi:hypothetical protein